MKLFWTRRGASDRASIREYITRDNPTAGLSPDGTFTEQAGLVGHPELGRLGRAAGTRELVVRRNYILIHEAAGQQVRVLRVLHAAQQWAPNA